MELLQELCSQVYPRGSFSKRRPPSFEHKARANATTWWLLTMMRNFRTPRVITGIITFSFSEVIFTWLSLFKKLGEMI